MASGRLLLFVFLILPAALQAAPAPVAKPARHAPTPDTLLANLRAEGYQILALAHGREPGTYAVTLEVQVLGDQVELFRSMVHRTFQVRADSADVRADLRAFLNDAPRAIKLRYPPLRANPGERQR